jgi:RES domain-containing protein
MEAVALRPRPVANLVDQLLVETPRIAYRGPGAIAIEGDEPWAVDRLITTDGGRWSRPGQPTIYLAADPGVALAEFGRHLPTAPGAPVGSLWRVRISLDGAADLRDAPNAIVLDEERCRTLADELRGYGIPGLVVPSVAFLDNRHRCNVVLFADVVADRMTDVIMSPHRIATVMSAPA